MIEKPLEALLANRWYCKDGNRPKKTLFHRLTG